AAGGHRGQYPALHTLGLRQSCRGSMTYSLARRQPRRAVRSLLAFAPSATSASPVHKSFVSLPSSNRTPTIPRAQERAERWRLPVDTAQVPECRFVPLPEPPSLSWISKQGRG